MQIEVVRGDITTLRIEAIVNPANSQLTMGGGLSEIIRRKGGREIEDEAMMHAPVPVGKAVMTKAGKLPCKYVIHAPTMEKPAQKIAVDNVRKAMRAVLRCAEENGFSEVAVPGLGTGVGGVPYAEASRAIIQEIRRFKTRSIRKIILVARNEKLYSAFASICNL